LGRFEGYLDGRGLELNTEKTKILRFEKREGKRKKMVLKREKNRGNKGI